MNSSGIKLLIDDLKEFSGIRLSARLPYQLKYSPFEPTLNITRGVRMVFSINSFKYLFIRIIERNKKIAHLTKGFFI